MDSQQRNTVSFLQELWSGCTMVPAALLRCYDKWGLPERDLVTLLRLLGPLLSRGRLRWADIAEEFDVPAEDAPTLVQPLLDLGLLSVEKGGRSYNGEGLLLRLLEDWQSCGQDAEEAPALPDGKERLAELSRLYRRFEAELGRNLKYSENEKLRQWLNEDNIAAPLIEEALRRAMLQSKPTMAYIGSILRSWQQQGLTDMEQVLKFDARRQEPPAPSGTKKGGKYKKLDEELLNA